MSPSDTLIFCVFIGLQLAGLTLVIRGVFEFAHWCTDFSIIQRLLMAKPLGCNLCMSFWAATAVVPIWWLLVSGETHLTALGWFFMNSFGAIALSVFTLSAIQKVGLPSIPDDLFDDYDDKGGQ
jgi:hypothetical protein